ncbi:hypothetical protein C8R43DRAFT_965968 [Mycena crocata]|nr:hypothetical protein C8R43DRAFT_965968 [Mycena crocata]
MSPVGCLLITILALFGSGFRLPLATAHPLATATQFVTSTYSAYVSRLILTSPVTPTNSQRSASSVDSQRSDSPGPVDSQRFDSPVTLTDSERSEAAAGILHKQCRDALADLRSHLQHERYLIRARNTAPFGSARYTKSRRLLQDNKVRALELARDYRQARLVLLVLKGPEYGADLNVLNDELRVMILTQRRRT